MNSIRCLLLTLAVFACGVLAFAATSSDDDNVTILIQTVNQLTVPAATSITLAVPTDETSASYTGGTTTDAHGLKVSHNFGETLSVTVTAAKDAGNPGSHDILLQVAAGGGAAQTIVNGPNNLGSSPTLVSGITSGVHDYDLTWTATATTTNTTITDTNGNSLTYKWTVTFTMADPS